MVYSVAYNCANKHTSNTNDYIQHASAIKTRPELTTPENYKKWLKRHTECATSLYRPHMEEPRAATGLPCTDKYHFILNDIM